MIGEHRASETSARQEDFSSSTRIIHPETRPKRRTSHFEELNEVSYRFILDFLEILRLLSINEKNGSHLMQLLNFEHFQNKKIE